MSQLETKTIISKISYVTDLKVRDSTGEAPAAIQVEKTRIFLPAILELMALAALFYVILR